MRLWLIVAGVSGAAGILAGAYGAHDLSLPAPRASWFATALTYHVWHTLALLGVACVAARQTGLSRRLVHAAGTLFAAGIVMFSGTLYFQAVAGATPLPLAAPAGGIAFVLGWLALAGAGLAARRG